MKTVCLGPAPADLPSTASTLPGLGDNGLAPPRLSSAPPDFAPPPPVRMDPLISTAKDKNRGASAHSAHLHDITQSSGGIGTGLTLPEWFLAEFPPRELRGKFESLWEIRVADLDDRQRRLIRDCAVLVQPMVLRNYLRMKRQSLDHILKGAPSPQVGRRPLMDAQAAREINARVSQAEQEKTAMTKQETLQLVRSAVEETARRDERSLSASPSIKMLREQAARVGVRFIKGQSTTQARWKAGRDLRNMATMAAMNSLYGQVPMEMLGNLDATTFEINWNEASVLATVVPLAPRRPRSFSPCPRVKTQIHPLTRVTTNVLGIFVKVFVVLAASGHVNLTFLMEDSSLGPSDLVHFPVVGLSINGDPSASSELCFCSTRQGNDAFFSFLFATAVPSFVAKVRVLAPSDSASAPFYLIIDGEATQSAILQTDAVRGILSGAGVVVVKGPASCSGQCGNPADMGNLFKAWKAVLGGAGTTLDDTDPGLSERLASAITAPGSGLAIPADKRRKIIAGLVRVVKAGTAITNVPRVVREGFYMLGLLPVDAKRTLQCCNGIYTQEEINKTLEMVPQLVNLVLAHGQITEKEMDDMGIPKAAEDKKSDIPKDQRPQQNQRAIVLNHDSAVARRKAFLEARAAKKAAVKKRAPKGATTSADTSKKSRTADTTAPPMASDHSTTSSSLSSLLIPGSATDASSSSTSSMDASLPPSRGRKKRPLSTAPQVGPNQTPSSLVSPTTGTPLVPSWIALNNEEKAATFRRETREAKRVREAHEEAVRKAAEKAAARAQKRKDKAALPRLSTEQQLKKLQQQAARLEKKRALLQALVASSSSYTAPPPPPSPGSAPHF